MSIQTRYSIIDQNVPDVRSFPLLSELPYFLRHHKRRLQSVNEMVVVVSNRRHITPSHVFVNAFHRHRSAYAAVDALAEPLAEFFLRTDILPVVEPIHDRFKDRLEELAPELYRKFSERGILIPTEERL